MSGVSECKYGGGSAGVMNEDIFIEDVQALSRNLFSEEHLQELGAFIVSSNGDSCVRFDLSHLVEHDGHLFYLLDP